MVINLLIAAHALPMCTLTSLSEEEILLPKYMNGSTNLRGLLFNKTAPSGRALPKTLKMVLDASLLNTQHYKVRIKGKVEKSRERSSALPYTLV